MRIEIFPVTSSARTGSITTWSWRAKNRGRVVASAHGYNSRAIAVKAAVNHGVQWGKLLGMESPLHVLRARVHAAVRVVT